MGRGTSRSPVVSEFNRNFGDMVYDLFYSVLWNHRGARTLHLGFWKKLDRELRQHPKFYQQNARAWVLKRAIGELIRSHRSLGRVMSASEQVMLDANLDIPARLRQFESYLHKLSVRDHALLLLRDKYGLPFSEIAAAMGMPEGALRVQHQQSLRSLEEWLWDKI
jgi:RNA polymerase sigma factor (sigma-70 family)